MLETQPSQNSAPTQKASAKTELSDTLRSLVHEAVERLGAVIEKQLGKEAFEQIESIRHSSKEPTDEHLQALYAKISKLPKTRRHDIAHAFSLLLELVNCCENAYRTYRLQSRAYAPSEPSTNIMYVLTAHPTEARAKQTIQVFREIGRALVRVLSGDQLAWGGVDELLSLAWKFPMAKPTAPSVRDEAEHLYTLSLRPQLIHTFIRLHRTGIPFFLRTWVGGDKDGHPGVSEVQFLDSLKLSRQSLLAFLNHQLNRLGTKLEMTGAFHKPAASLSESIEALKPSLRRLKKMAPEDGRNIAKLRKALNLIATRYDKIVGFPTEESANLHSFLELFPGLVVPIELREAAEVLRTKDPHCAIARMVKTLGEIGRGGEITWYARGLVVSMTECSNDLQLAFDLVSRSLGKHPLPVIPLFEKQSAIENSIEIVSGFIANPKVAHALNTSWNKTFEVMLGYSDSAKEFGSLPSRLGLERAVHDLDEFLRSKHARPVFFHGAGGSVERGGGSVREQMAWWPESALNPLKITVQGEMIQRSFSSKEIFLRQIEKTVEQRGRALKPYVTNSAALDTFSKRVQERYQETIASELFLEVIQKCTPFPFLSQLQIGSRPAKRRAKFSVGSVRAIPWVLCWTQTRILFPAWWGVGTAWEASSEAERIQLRKDYQDKDVFGSYVKLLGFTLMKVRMPVWRFYVLQSDLDEEQKEQVLKDFSDEYDKTVRFVHEISGENNLLWFRPWLSHSIRLRSNMIHPLNLLQKIALDTRDLTLLRETVAGIASGMLTTG